MSKAFVGKPAPAFSGEAVFNGEFQSVNSSQFAGKYLVLFFYPLDWTFVCPTEIIDFSEKYEQFQKMNCEVLGVSVDSKFSHLAWLETPRKKGGLGRINFPLLSDLTQQIARDYGVLMEEAGHTLRGLFVIDGNGIIRHLSMNDPPVSRNVDEVLRLVAGYQFADEHGEVCPAGWKKAGDLTIVPDPQRKIAYFEAVNQQQ
eukprot:TRINITY_DN760_c0_g2_i1.p1 TRINITY_DN760_c0_g2~~TRINITY_DN760_c0_g2_i1.p1  ORF type:complete len:201 (+),score=94.28 TRINITY_DN760_c0_g2_i1:71-673(+)